MFFKKEKKILTSQEAIEQAIDLIKDLDRREFKKFTEGADLINQGWCKAIKVQTREDKEDRDINILFEETGDKK